MSKTRDYAYTKPELVEGYRDQTGRIHNTLEQAERADFNHAMWAAAHECDHRLPQKDFERAIRKLVKGFPGVLNKIIEEERGG